jgi:beta-xylosidase
VDHGKVVESRAWHDFNAIDPNLVIVGKGRSWLAFGSFWSGIKLVEIDRRTGKPDQSGENLLSIAARPRRKAIEAPFIVSKNGYYYLFASFDFCCKGADSTYNIVVGRSRDVTGPYQDRSGRPMTNGGGTLVLAGYGHVRGPGHNAVLLDGERDWLVHHFYDANANGIPTLQIRPLTWDADGWPIAGKPLEGPPAKPSGAEQPVERKQEPSASKSPQTGECQIWEWQVRGKQPFRLWLHVNGLVSRGPEPGTDPGFTWSRSGTTITVRWPQGWIDTMEVQPGGNSLSGQNQYGARIKARLVERVPSE